MKALLAVLLLFAGAAASAQQVPDLDADIRVETPAYAAGEGPMLMIDGAHNNFHTAKGGFAPFAALAINDGYRVASLNAAITPERLAKAELLVIANPLAQANVGNWRLPTPSAFTEAEIAAVRAWVEGGGSLLLIADHMPFAGAASDLALAFGFRFDNGFARDRQRGPERFSRDNGRLPDSVIARGEAKGEPVTRILSFTGSSFTAPAGAVPVIMLDDGWTILTPEVAWEFDGDTHSRRASAADLRGAVLEVGDGRVAVFAEAAMFTAQRAGPNRRPMGFNADGAEQNKQFILNLLHWLSRAE